MQTKNEYTAEKITVLKGLEAVKKRPAMYIGDVSKKGLHHLIWEVVDNWSDETLAGFCDEINVELISNVHIEGNTKIQKGTKIFPFASIGTAPQDLKYKGEDNSLEIGENNVIREYVTINPGTIGGGR